MRSFAVQQALLLVFGICFALLSLYYVRQLEQKAELAKLKSDITLAIERKSDQLRAWHSLGLNEAIDQEVTLLTKSYPTLKLSFVQKSELPHKLLSNEIQIPGVDDPYLDIYILAQFQSESSLAQTLRDPNIYISSAAILLLILSNIMLGTRFFSKKVIQPLSMLKSELSRSSKSVQMRNPVEEQGEIGDFIEDIVRITNENYKLQTEKDAFETQAAIGALASQVSHDIRSPLAALNMVVKQLSGLPEEHRLLVRNSVGRINDIANSLLQKSKTSSLSESNLPEKNLGTVSELLPALIDGLVSEKRIQFRDMPNIEIECDLENCYGIFANIDAVELKRVLSNLINNSVEAIEVQYGKIRVSLSSYENEIQIVIEDNGKGIPSHILNRLGDRGLSYGKNGNESGSGLGLYHAIKTVESMGGKLLIQSNEGAGTEIRIVLKRVDAPSWFVKKIVIPENSIVVSIDDDLSIHCIWKERLKKLGLDKDDCEHISFTSGLDFKSWFKGQQIASMNKKAFLFLFDYELLNQGMNGLDLIEELDIGSRSILVTSRYDEKDVLHRSENLGVKLIPKPMAAAVPVAYGDSKTLYQACLIDDDPLVRMVWELAAKEAGAKIRTFDSFDSLADNVWAIDLETPMSIDVDLANGIRGTDVAMKIHKMGFKQIYLATGYDADSIEGIPICVSGVRGKQPVFQ